ncbi:hypothetical protein ABW13_02805 [Pluralibacter gergoviae]|nr:hypothetical protein ABW13_02805 [Pluralibacter gergoviae]OHY68340.1 hypothetical protein BB778_14205 [Pluralibacter gergoviae]
MLYNSGPDNERKRSLNSLSELVLRPRLLSYLACLPCEKFSVLSITIMWQQRQFFAVRDFIARMEAPVAESSAFSGHMQAGAGQPGIKFGRFFLRRCVEQTFFFRCC